MAERLMDHGLVRRLQEQVADALTAEKVARTARGLADLRAQDEQQLALSLINEQVALHMSDELEQGRALPDHQEFDVRLADAVFAAMYQAGELQELLDDELVEDIDINGCDEVWVSYADHRGRVRGNPVAESDDVLVEMVQNLAAYAGVNPRPFSTASPQVDVRLHDGSRLSAVMLAGERPAVSIRRNRFPKVFLPTLVEQGTLSEQLAVFLDAVVKARFNVMIAGSTGAGKTTLLRAMANCIPAHERIVVVEQALELGFRRHLLHLHPNVVELEQVLPDADGKGGISLDALVRRSRRMNPDRIIMGEILGPEVDAVLSAMSQGNDGSLSTIHARSAEDTLEKLTTYGAMYGGMGVDLTARIVAQTVDFVVFIRKNDRTGTRTVSEVVEVVGMAEHRPATSRLFVPSAVDGRAERVSAVQIARAERLADAGYDDTAWPSTDWNVFEAGLR